MTFTTAGLADSFDGEVEAAEPILTHYGGLTAFSGSIVTLDVFEDSGLLRKTLQEAGQGKVLIVDGGGSLQRALMGQDLAQLALDNGWEGLILYGCVRHTRGLGKLSLGVMALAATPKGPTHHGRGSRKKPVHFAGVTFRPGYFVYADGDGVLVCARELPLEAM